MDVGIPEIMLIIGGLVSFLLVYLYRSDKDSGYYKAATVLGVIVGAIMIIFAATSYSNWPFFDSVLIIIAGFALVIRPFRDTDFAIIIAIVVMIVVYVYLGQQTGDFESLSHGTPRIIITIVAGAVAYMILHFVVKLAQLIGKILNFWPVLFILGCICLVEGALIIAGGKTLYDYIQDYRNTEQILRSVFYYLF